MNLDKNYIGLHITSQKNLLNTIKKYRKIANIFQFFLGSPRRNILKISQDKINEMNEIKKYVKENNIKLFIHTPYTLNFSADNYKNNWWTDTLIKELNYADKMGVVGCVLHLGKSLDNTIEKSFLNMKKSIEYVLKKTKKLKSKIILETSTGQGTEIGSDLFSFSKFYNSFDQIYKNRLGICVDTCHVFSAGHDFSSKIKFKQFIKLLDKLFKLKNIDLIHYNDCKVPFGSRVDRHEIIGKGYMKNFIRYIGLYFLKLNIPLLFETPRERFKDDIKYLFNIKK